MKNDFGQHGKHEKHETAFPFEIVGEQKWRHDQNSRNVREPIGKPMIFHIYPFVLEMLRLHFLCHGAHPTDLRIIFPFFQNCRKRVLLENYAELTNSPPPNKKNKLGQWTARPPKGTHPKANKNAPNDSGRFRFRSGLE